ncbi:MULTISPECIES: FtsK/SpoIIIE family DNA translocase [Thermoanaerobacterium]|uniref:Cell division protein FtsK/SpoIIIE n=1 Tax=Thermoanaerobacterium xylanolyticum (strain ATCC 49914 / DSM 7097 / LX-11) TaxID=858215 RepID=F6BFG5_THEXL|nr:DNA translocase FtsK [Thermoanaerobacterium xylanolyticum]AEF17304.1 cell division protein FtsK/SpoIIIE [Thermoanaerobacterium xylanolyticum LX-11]
MKSKTKEKYNNEIVGIILLTFSIISMISLYSDKTGIVGKELVILLKSLFGVGAYAISLLILVYSLFLLFKNKNFLDYKRIICLLITFLCFINMVQIYFYDNIGYFKNYVLDSIKHGLNGSGGGIVSAITVFVLVKFLGVIGSWLFLISTLIISIILITDISLIESIKSVYRQMYKLIEKYKNKKKTLEFNNENILRDIVEKPDEKKLSRKKIANNEEQQLKIIQPYLEEKEETEEKKDQSEDEVKISKIENKGRTYENYIYPPIELLKEGIPHQKVNNNLIIENAKKLEETLKNFAIDAKVVQVSRGPAITRFELQPSPGVKVSRIVSLTDDIALSLAAPSVRIEAPIPGKSAIGIEVPNEKISVVTLREVIDTKKFRESKSDLTIGLGKDIAGNIVIADLSKMPHLLIAGATGSGKSVCINTLIVSLLYKASPDKVKMILIDPKVVELNIYNGIPHLLTPVVTDPKKAAGVLNWAVNEMTERYKAFAENNVRDIEGYNKIHGIDTMPKIVVIVDELSDLMMVSPAEVEEYICRLAQMARAAGIYLVIATQRPSVDVITGVIKANIPSRISFAVSSQIDSRTILDMSGAEKLLGKGDMLYYPIGESKPIRVQGAFISDKEVEEIVNFLKSNANEPKYEEIIVESKSTLNKEIEEDELMNDAIKVIVETGQASISMLQRRLRIGYARAARIIDQMEQKGIISGYDGSKPRQILLSEEEIKRIING